MKRILCVALALVAVALVAGCNKGMHDEKEKGEAMGAGGKVAVAHIQPAGAASTQPSMGNAAGTVTFTQMDHKVKVVADLTGLPPGKHGIHIHEKPDLSSPDLMSAGGHYNPDGGTHYHGGPSTNPLIHAGDLGNITADSSGNAHMELTVSNISIGGKNDIQGRSVIIHAKADDLKSQPSGASGGRIAGGVIEVVKM